MKNLNSSKIQNYPPDICTDSSSSGNASSNVLLNVKSEIFSIQYELLEFVEELQKPIKESIGENDGLEDYFCSDTIFNLSNKVLSDPEVKVFEIGLDFAPTLQKINESELRKDFHVFCRKMRIRWNFRNEPSLDFS